MTTSPAVTSPRLVSTRQPLPTRAIRPTAALAQTCDVAPPAGVEQALVIERRVQFARALDHHAAVVIVAGDLLALALARHHVGARSGRRVEQRHAPRIAPRNAFGVQAPTNRPGFSQKQSIASSPISRSTRQRRRRRRLGDARPGRDRCRAPAR